MSTKEDIIEAATWLYAERGYEGMTMKEIASKVGIKAPSVYAFFQSKEDLFIQVYQGILSDHLALAEKNAVEFQHLSAKEQLDQLLHTVIQFQHKDSMKMKILIRLMLFPPKFFSEDLRAQFIKLEKRETELLCQIFQRGIDRGEIREEESSKLATAMICMMDGLFWEMQRHDEESFQKRFEIIWEQFWKGIKK